MSAGSSCWGPSLLLVVAAALCFMGQARALAKKVEVSAPWPEFYDCVILLVYINISKFIHSWGLRTIYAQMIMLMPW